MILLPLLLGGRVQIVIVNSIFIKQDQIKGMYLASNNFKEESISFFIVCTNQDFQFCKSFSKHNVMKSLKIIMLEDFLELFPNVQNMRLNKVILSIDEDFTDESLLLINELCQTNASIVILADSPKLRSELVLSANVRVFEKPKNIIDFQSLMIVANYFIKKGDSLWI